MITFTSEQVVCVVNYLATFVFALGGARFAAELYDSPCTGRVITALIGSALCSHGGGMFFRDTIAGVATRMMAMPSALTASSWDTWTIAFVAFVSYLEYDRNKSFKEIFSGRTWRRLFSVIDAAGLGIFVTMGTERGMSFFHVRNFAALVYLGWGTSVGGGIITTILVRPNPDKKIIKNVPYYVKACILASVAAFVLVMHYTDSNTIALVLAFLSGAVTYIEESIVEVTNREHFTISNKENDPVLRNRQESISNIPIRILLNPFKGIHVYKQTSFSQGRGNTCYMIVNMLA